MSDTDNSTILLKIQSDVAGIRSMQEAFGKLQEQTRNAGKEVESLGSKLSGMAGNSVFALGAAFKLASLSVDGLTSKIGEAVGGTTELAHQMKEVTRATGLAGEAAQVLSKAGKVSFSELETHLQRYRSLLGEALLSKDSAAAKLFTGNLGLDAKELSASPMEDQLEKIAAAFGKVTDQNVQARLAMELFGRNSGAMLGLLDNLRVEGYDRMKKSVEETAGVLGEGMEKAILKEERAAAAANNRLSISFARTNLQLLTAKADVAKFMADHSTAISSVGQSLAAVGVGLSLSAAITNINWTKIGAASGGLMGVSMGAAVAGALVLAVTNSMQEAIDKQSAALNEIWDKSGKISARLRTVSSSAEVASTIADAKANRAALIKESRDLYDRIQSGVGTGNGFGQGDIAERYQAVKRAIKELDVMIAKGGAAGEKNAAINGKAKADALALENAKELSAELTKNAKEYEKQLIVARYSAASEQTKLSMLDQQTIAAGKQFEIDSGAAVLAKDDAALATAKVKYDLELAKIAIDRETAIKAIAAAEKQVAEIQAKALRDQIELSKSLLEVQKESIDSRLNELEADYTRNDIEKWTEKKNLMLELVAADQAHLDKLREARAAAPAESRAPYDSAILTGERNLGHDQKQLAGLGPDPRNIGAVLSKNFADLRASFGTVANSITSVMGAAFNGVSGSLEGLIGRTMTWSQAFHNVLSSIGSAALHGFSSMVTGWIFSKERMAAVSKLFGVQEVATQAATTATTTGIHAGGEAAKTGSTLFGTLARGALHLGETIFHGVQVLFRVGAHVAGEAAMTAGTLLGTLMRIPMIIAESIGHVFKAGVAALSSLSAIPIVGPFLGIAAMATVIALGMGAVGKIGKGFAEGGFTERGHKDKAVGVVHAGEWVAPKWMVEDPKYGEQIAALEGARNGGKGMKLGGYFVAGLGPSQKADRGNLPTVSSGQFPVSGGSKRRGGASGILPVSGNEQSVVNIGFHNTKMDALAALNSLEGRRIMIDFIRQNQSEI